MTKLTARFLKYFLVVASLAGQAPSAFALEEEPKIFRGIRSEGMGGLITTTGNYSESLFGNPARLSEVDVSKWSLLDTTLETNTTLFSTTGQFASLKSSSGAGTISNAASLVGQTEHLLFQMLVSSYYDPKFIGDLGFAIGLYTGLHTTLAINYTTDLDTQTIFDIGPNVGFSYPFLNNQLSVGMSIHFLYRVSVDGEINSLSFLTGGKFSLQNFAHQGFGADVDIGAYYHVPWELDFMRINFGASASGLLKSHYDTVVANLISSAATRPINNDRLLNIGTRLDFPDTWIFSAPIFGFEVQDIGDAQKRFSFAKRTHMGVEGKLSQVFALRLGLNQGYATFGIGIDLPVLKLDFSTYGEELAGTVGQREDRRFAMRMAFEI